MEKERIPSLHPPPHQPPTPARPPASKNRTWVVCVIYQQDNHYTTPTADSVNEIKYLRGSSNK